MLRRPRERPILLVCTLVGAGCAPPALDPSKVSHLTAAPASPDGYCVGAGTVPLVISADVEGKGHQTTRAGDFSTDDNFVVSASVGQVRTRQHALEWVEPSDATPLLKDDVTIKVSLVGRQDLTTTVTLVPRFSCGQTQGATGASGRSGAAGIRPTGGGPADNGPEIEAHLSYVASEKRGPLVAARLKFAGSNEKITYTSLKGGRITLLSRGGTGGAGGNGDDGHATIECPTDEHRADDGANGANGGQGGAGGHIRIYVDPSHREVLEHVTVDNAGGRGGPGGHGGKLGTAVNQPCGAGHDGTNGQPGVDGPAGTVEVLAEGSGAPIKDVALGGAPAASSASTSSPAPASSGDPASGASASASLETSARVDAGNAKADEEVRAAAAKLATGALPIVAMRVADDDRNAVELRADGSISASAKGGASVKIGDVRGGVVTTIRGTFAYAKDGTIHSVSRMMGPHVVGSIAGATVTRGRKAAQLDAKGEVRMTDAGKPIAGHVRFDAPVPARARATAAMLVFLAMP